MWDWDTGWDNDVLKRIVILLFSLANLADLAAGAPFLRRRKVLGILNHGELDARAFVIGMPVASFSRLELYIIVKRTVVHRRPLPLEHAPREGQSLESDSKAARRRG